ARLEKQAQIGTSLVPKAGLFTGIRVLVVDDNSTNRKVLHHHLCAWDLENECVAGGDEALEWLRRASGEGRPFNLIISDLRMPKMDGFMLLRAIKADPRIPPVKVILATSISRRPSDTEMCDYGIDECLIKPLKQSQLFNTLVSVLSDKLPEDLPVEEKVASQEPPAPVARKHLRILVAEDNAVNQKVAAQQLRKLGYTADVVGNGVEALETLERIPYDVVLMDCQMPEMDGYEATRRIRQREKENVLPHLRIVAMTANAMEGDREKCLAAGMDDFMTKPVRIEELESVLEQSALVRLSPPLPETPRPYATVNPNSVERLREWRAPG